MELNQIVFISGIALCIVSFVTLQVVWIPMSLEKKKLWEELVGKNKANILWTTLLLGIILLVLGYLV
jgi:hypothetical protein